MSGNLTPDDDLSFGGSDDDGLSEDDQDFDALLGGRYNKGKSSIKSPSATRKIRTSAATPTKPASALASPSVVSASSSATTTHRRNPYTTPAVKYTSASGGSAGGADFSMDRIRKLKQLNKKNAKKSITRNDDIDNENNSGIDKSDAITFPTPALHTKKSSVSKRVSDKSLTSEEIYGESNLGLGPSTSFSGLKSTGVRRPKSFGSRNSSREKSMANIKEKKFFAKKGRRSVDSNGLPEEKEIALANLATASENDMSAAARIVMVGNNTIPPKRFKMGENVLVAFHVLGNYEEGLGSDQQLLKSRPVNKFGFPQGMGKAEVERRGPYNYVLARVLEVKFDENSPYYLVKRYDTENTERADNGWIEPIPPQSAGEKAAMAAAKQSIDTNGSHQTGPNNLFDNVFLRKCYKSVQSCRLFCGDQAMSCLSGGAPYRIECKITTVNVLVFCSIIVAFLNQIRYAFFGIARDFAVMVIIFAAWLILMLELILEVCVRPKDYAKLLRTERAFSPRTVRYINTFHLFFEFVALMFAIPDFLPLFTKNTEKTASFIQAAIHASHGKTDGQFLLGHFFFMLTRMRLFGLVRHKRNHWISKQSTSTPCKEVKELKPLLSDESKPSPKKHREDLIGDLDEDATLRRADTIGTALVLVNSQRTLLLLLLITFIVPLFVVLANGGRSMTIYTTTEYLHALNNDDLTTDSAMANEDFNCMLFEFGVESWCNAQNYDPSNVTGNVMQIYLEPARKSDKCKASCLNKPDEPTGIRNSALLNVTLTGDNGNTTVTFDMSKTVKRTAFNFLMLQLTSLLSSIFWLKWLRSDAKRNVIAPLRRMLKIVLRYAENPLAGDPTRKDDSIDELDDLEEPEKDAAGTKLLAHETAQLIAAVTTITGLLRKCWGVAGAGIISSNLARNIGGENIVVFNPIVPGKQVYALFGFAGISDYSFILRSLEKDTMTFINDVARVLHNEVFRWGFGESGQCNRNLGSAFLLVYRIGDFAEVAEMKARAIDVFFQMGDGKKDPTRTPVVAAEIDKKDLIQLASLPGISRFADRALLGILKTFAGIYRDKNIKKWEDTDYRLGGGVGAFSFEMTFGMDAGWAVEGAVGSSYKIDATYLSPHLNMASRMMMAAKQYKVAVLITQGMEELLSSPAKEVMRHLDTIYVKGSKIPQRVYTYDARKKGVDYFLNQRKTAIADREAENYREDIWTKDSDLRDMRSHVSPEFEVTYSMGLQQYLIGNFTEALAHFRAANDIMVEGVVKDGRLESANAVHSKLLDSNSRDDGVLTLREELGDGPCQALIRYIEEERNCIPPDDWHGVRKLTNK